MGCGDWKDWEQAESIRLFEKWLATKSNEDLNLIRDEIFSLAKTMQGTPQTRATWRLLDSLMRSIR